MMQSSMTRARSHLLQLPVNGRIRSMVIQPATVTPILSVLALAAPLVVYSCTLAPTVHILDSAELTTGSYLLGLVHAPGYPLYLILGKLFSFLPFGNVAYRVNLMSGVFAAATSLITFWVLLRLTQRRFISLGATFALAFSYYFWQEAVVAEAYTLETFMIALFLLVLLKWRAVGSGNRWLSLLALLFGLSLGNRTTTALFFPSVVLFILAETRGSILNDHKTLFLTFIAFLLGLCIYLYLPFRYLADPPLNYASEGLYGVNLTTPGGMWWMISGRMYHFYAFGYGLAEAIPELTSYLGRLWRNFLGVGVLVGVLGWLGMWRKDRRTFALIFLPFALYVGFFVNYRVVDKDTMFLPSYLLWTVALAHGYAWIADACEAWSHRLRPTRSDVSAAAVVVVTVIAIGALGGILNWRWADRSDDIYTEKFARQILAEVPPDALIVADWSPAVVLEYFQLVEGYRPDVRIMNRSRFTVAQYYHYWRSGLSHEEIVDLVALEELHAVRQDPVRHVVCVDDLAIPELALSPCLSY